MLEPYILAIITLVTSIVTFGGISYANTSVLKSNFKNIDAEIGEIKTQIKDLSKVVIGQVAQNGRMDRQDDRIIMQGQRLDNAEQRLNSLVDNKLLDLLHEKKQQP